MLVCSWWNLVPVGWMGFLQCHLWSWYQAQVSHLQQPGPRLRWDGMRRGWYRWPWSLHRQGMPKYGIRKNNELLCLWFVFQLTANGGNGVPGVTAAQLAETQNRIVEGSVTTHLLSMVAKIVRIKKLNPLRNRRVLNRSAQVSHSGALIYPSFLCDDDLDDVIGFDSDLHLCATLYMLMKSAN